MTRRRKYDARIKVFCSLTSFLLCKCSIGLVVRKSTYSLVSVNFTCSFNFPQQHTTKPSVSIPSCCILYETITLHSFGDFFIAKKIESYEGRGEFPGRRVPTISYFTLSFTFSHYTAILWNTWESTFLTAFCEPLHGHFVTRRGTRKKW
jgi:hypothetical protein